MNKKVSIITPLFNAERYVSETIKSVLNQSYQNWEMIFVDDCSSDQSVSIVEKYKEKDERIRLLKNKTNMGSGHSRNRAIDAASGDIIAFLDSDDIWHPEKLSKHLEFMQKNSSVFSHTSYGFINEKGQIIKSTYRVSNKPVDYKKLLKRTEISCLTAMFDVHQIGKMHMPPLPKAQDYALWLDILKRGVVSSFGVRIQNGIVASSSRSSILECQFYLHQQRVESLNIDLLLFDQSFHIFPVVGKSFF